MAEKFQSRYKGPVTDRNFDDLDSDVERQAFIFEAQERAEAIARTFGRKHSFMRRVAIELYSIAEGALSNGT